MTADQITPDLLDGTTGGRRRPSPTLPSTITLTTSQIGSLIL